MGSVIRSVSMTPDENSFLDDYRLSPSQLLKEKIWEFRGALKKLVGEKVQRMAKVINDQQTRIEELENVLEKENPINKQ